MCIRRLGRVLTVFEPCYVVWINSNLKYNDLPESKGWRGYRWKPAERGRSLVSRNGNPKQPDISIAKLGKGTREVGEAHSTD